MRARARCAKGGAVMLGKRVERFWENGREPERPSVEHRTLKLVYRPQSVTNSLWSYMHIHRARTDVLRKCG